MDIQVVSTGEEIFKADDGCARALLAAFPEAFQRIAKSPAARPEHKPFWGTGRQGGYLDFFVTYKCPARSEIIEATTPEAVVSLLEVKCCGGRVETMPKEAIRRFLAEYRCRNDAMSSSGAAAHNAALEKLKALVGQ